MTNEFIKNFNYIRECFDHNYKLFSIISIYLNEYPDLIKPHAVKELLDTDGDLSESEAFGCLLASYLGIDPDEEPELEHLFNSINDLATCLDPALYKNDPYIKNINVPNVKNGEWEMTELEYKPYEGFIWNESDINLNYRECPRVGFFKERFSFPAVLQSGREWMAIKPNEIETMRGPIEEAKGSVITLGLGMGYYTYMVSEKKSVKKITVIERDEKVITLFKKHILPQIPCKDKISIIHSDAFDYLDTLTAVSDVDMIFADIWHDAADGLPLYLKIKKYEDKLKNIRFSYWIEQSLISEIRSMLVQTACEQIGRDDRIDIAGREFDDFMDFHKFLSDESLRELAKKIRRADG